MSSDSERDVVFDRPILIQDEQATCHANAQHLHCLLEGYEAVAIVVLGLRSANFTPISRQASGISSVRRVAGSCLGLLSRRYADRLRVLIGIGLTTPTIPALFWSSGPEYLHAAANVAMLYGFYQDDGDALYEFIDDILDSTATLRIMMYEKGAFVGWLPLAFKSRVDLAPHHQSEYTEQWREMPLENAFYCPEWTEEVLYYSPGEVEVPVAGSVEAKHVGYINGRYVYQEDESECPELSEDGRSVGEDHADAPCAPPLTDDQQDNDFDENDAFNEAFNGNQQHSDANTSEAFRDRRSEASYALSVASSDNVDETPDDAVVQVEITGDTMADDYDTASDTTSDYTSGSSVNFERDDGEDDDYEDDDLESYDFENGATENTAVEPYTAVLNAGPDNAHDPNFPIDVEGMVDRFVISLLDAPNPPGDGRYARSLPLPKSPSLSLPHRVSSDDERSSLMTPPDSEDEDRDQIGVVDGSRGSRGSDLLPAV